MLCPVWFGAIMLLNTLDMLTGRCLSANVETHLGSAASAQFVKDVWKAESQVRKRLATCDKG